MCTCLSLSQYSVLDTHYRYVSVLVTVVTVLVEVGRLYLAYEGNLREKVLISHIHMVMYFFLCVCCVGKILS